MSGVSPAAHQGACLRGDVIVVGAGGAGVNAAIAAAEAGAVVTVLDAAGTVGGTARHAGGGTCMAGSPRQCELGIQDSLDLALSDWMAMGGDDADEAWARRYLEASAGQLYQQLTTLGVRFGDVRWNEGNTVPRWHSPVGGGRAVMQALERHARSLPSIRWCLGSSAIELVTAAGSVVGVLADGPHGPVEHRAPNVLVAAGGFSSDAAMVRRYGPDDVQVPRLLLGGGQGARGIGHRLLERVGAGFVNLDALWMYPYATPDPDDPDRGLVVRDLHGDVWVNQRGERFHDESLRGGATGTPALLAQPGATCWAIIDARISRQLTVADPKYRDGATPDRAAIDHLLDTSPHVTTAQDLRDLGDQVGIDGTVLSRTVAEHNRARVGDRLYDPDFGRRLAGLPALATPPFTAIQFFPVARKNLGGVQTDPDCRVLDASGRVIDGLYAAGEVAGMAGGHVNGRAALEGTMFGPSLYSGTVAGRAMVA